MQEGGEFSKVLGYNPKSQLVSIPSLYRGQPQPPPLHFPYVTRGHRVMVTQLQFNVLDKDTRFYLRIILIGRSTN